MKRHGIDQEVLGFVMDKFSENIDDGNNWEYKHKGSTIEVSVNKRQVTKLDSKIVVELIELSNEDNSLTNKSRFKYELSFGSSNKLREFIEDLEDLSNEDYIRNTSEDVLDFIKRNK